MSHPDETRAVAERYARRALAVAPDRYSLLRPEVWQSVQERQRAMLRLFARLGWTTLADKTLLEVGCGAGDNLLDLLRMGFAPRHLQGIELLPERFALARERLPAGVHLHAGDATVAPITAGSLDIVHQATVFSSLLDDAFQQRLADAMWDWVKPGGGVLWYDFTINNPRNADVRGVPLARVQQLFPAGRIEAHRITLAPPLARAACAVHPALYRPLACVTWMRTHTLAWVCKPSD